MKKIFDSPAFWAIFSGLVFCIIMIVALEIENREREDFITRTSTILENHKKENSFFIKKWEAKQKNFTTKDIEELVTEFCEIDSRHQKELKNLLDSIKPKEEEE